MKVAEGSEIPTLRLYAPGPGTTKSLESLKRLREGNEKAGAPEFLIEETKHLPTVSGESFGSYAPGPGF